MALVAALPHPAQLVRSTTAYLVAPAPLDDGVAYLTVPRRDARPGVMARVAGDRLVVVRTTGAKELVDGFCDSAAGCAAVGAPVGDGADVVFGLPTDGGGGYVGRSAPDGRIRIVHSDEAGDAVPLYAAAGGRTVFVGTGGIASRTGKDPATVLVPAAGTAGVVRALGASAGAVAWVARQPVNGPWTVGVRVGSAAPVAFTDVRRGVRIGRPAVTDDGTAAFAQRIPAGPAGVQFQVIVLRAGVEQVVASSPVVPIADQDPVPRVALHSTTVVYRLRVGAAGRSEAIFATDLATSTTRLIARKGRRAARMSDPGIGRNRVVWAQTDFRAGRFVRSRVLRVRLAL